MATRTDPAARAGRRSAAADVLQAGRELADELRRSDRFFKLRVGIVAAWVVLSLATLWGACAAPGQRNALGADVQVNRDSLMGVQLLVRNDSDHIWEDVVLTLDDGWKYSQRTMRPQDLVVLSLASFRKGDEAPPRDHRPRALSISCAQGSGRFELR
jgi:hypothetical protein